MADSLDFLWRLPRDLQFELFRTHYVEINGMLAADAIGRPLVRLANATNRTSSFFLSCDFKVGALTWMTTPPQVTSENMMADWNRLTGFIRNQFPHLLCWAFAASDLLSGMRNLHGWDNMYVLYCPWFLCRFCCPAYLGTDRRAHSGHVCYGGSIWSALEFIRRIGIPREALEELKRQPVCCDVIVYPGLSNDCSETGMQIYAGPNDQYPVNSYGARGMSGYHALIMTRLLDIGERLVAMCKMSNGTEVGYFGYVFVCLSTMYVMVGASDEHSSAMVRPTDRPMHLLSNFVVLDMYERPGTSQPVRSQEDSDPEGKSNKDREKFKRPMPATGLYETGSSSTGVSVSEASSDIDIPTESATLTAVSLEFHTSGRNGVVENSIGKSESEAIQDIDFVENSKAPSEIGAVDASTSDESMNTHQESQDASEPACNQDGKQHIASEVKEVLDAPASEESSDAVSVSKAPMCDGLSCTNQQESERDEISGLVEKLQLHEDAPSDNDTSVNLNDDTISQGFSEDHGVDTNQKIQDDCSAQSKEVTVVNEKHGPIEKVQVNNSEGNINIGGDVCLTSSEEAKESPTGDLAGNEIAETISTNINGSSSLLDSKTAVSKLAESSAEGAVYETGAVATKSEAAQSVKGSTEPHVVEPDIEDCEINREVICGSEVSLTKTTPVDVCEDTPSEEISEMEESDIKERSVMKTDEEVDSTNKSLDSTESPLVNNDIVKVTKEEEKNETSGATGSAASETKTCAQDLESKVVTSTVTINTGAEDCVDSQHAEIKGGDAARTDDKVQGSALDASEGHTVAADIERRPFYFLHRVPRYDDETLAERLKHAEAQVDEEIQSRDALRADIQKIRATCKDYDSSYKAAMAEEERSARKAMHSKRQEIEALQSLISRVKSAASVDDIESRVHNMEHMIQHETLSLCEEIGFIREIKQLKQLRGQISSSVGTNDEVTNDEVKQALDEKEKTEERFKVLRKELDVLRNDLSKAEAVAKAAQKKCDKE